MFRQALNQRGFYYSTYTSSTDVTSNVTGLPTGEKTSTFATPVFAWGHISSSTGKMTTDGYGWNIDYDINIVLSHDLPITEGSRLWINSVPDAQGDVRHDHEVVRVMKSLNETVIAAKRCP